MSSKSFSVADIATFSRATIRVNEHHFVDYLDTGNLTNGTILSLEHYTDLSKLPSRAKKIVVEGDILFSTVRPNNRHYGIIRGNCDNLVVSSGFSVIRANPKFVLPEYLYYLLTSNSIVELLQSIAEQSVSAYPSINDSDIAKLEFEIPSVSVQSIIVGIIESINQKIITNRRINDNLLRIARSEYESFKESYEYTLRPLSDIASLNAKSIGNKDTFSEINYLDTGSITSGIVDGYQHLSIGIDEVPSRAKRIVQPNDIVFSTVRPSQKHFGILTSIPDNCVVSTGFTTICSIDKSISNEMIYLEISSDEVVSILQQIAETSTSAYPSIRPEDLGDVEVPIFQDCDILMKFLKNTFLMIDSNHKEIQALSACRNYLLPKLMSGEIDVSTLELPTKYSFGGA